MAHASPSDTIGAPPAPPDQGGYGGGDGGESQWGGSRRASFTGLLVAIAATTMVFGALSSAYFVRRDVSAGWMAAPLPGILWLNTAVLLASSAFLEIALYSLKTGRRTAFNRWWTAGAACGVTFLAGQGVAWRQLRDAGLYISGDPAGAFFYLLTIAHAVHLLAGITALAYIWVRAIRFELGPARRTGAELTAMFWHFLDALWLYLLALFSFWG
ncbi:MAG TPA: cytochrome c oxidase subunit 3 [Bryobacteraceae bacterium]|nr:cytochrome c oxidase subunit 3 [Bryobacteraceae bacterium]